MRFLRRFTSFALAALIAAPAPAFAQMVRLTLETQVRAPVFAPVPSALSSPALSLPGLAPLSLALPVLPAPSIGAVPVVAAAAPVALASVVKRAPSAPDRPDEERRAEAGKIFDGSIAPAGSDSVVIPLDLDRKLSGLGRAAAPRPWVEKTKVLAAYGGLAAAAVALNAPFEHVGPMIVGAVMAPMLSFVGLFFYSASQSAVESAPLEGEEAKPSGETMAMIERLAAEAKVSAPARVKVLPGDKVQAQVGARDAAGYEIRYTRAFEALRPDVREAILRHEFAHQRHHDMPWQIAQIFLVTFAPMMALMAADGKSALAGTAIAAIVAASVLILPASLRRSEYLADQYAASKREGAAPLARFFIEDDENPARAATALAGRPFAEEKGLKRAALLAWDWLKTSYKAHPSHDRRIARLVRLSEKEKVR